MCQRVGLSPVELRTTHEHGVEPNLTKDQRKEVRQRFADAGVGIWGCGTVCEFHSPDPALVKKNIDTCKEFVELAALPLKSSSRSDSTVRTRSGSSGTHGAAERVGRFKQDGAEQAER